MRLVAKPVKEGSSSQFDASYNELVERAVELLDSYLQKHLPESDDRNDPYWIRLNEDLDAVRTPELVADILKRLDKSHEPREIPLPSNSWPLLAFLVGLRSTNPLGTPGTPRKS